MIAVIQRASSAQLHIEGQLHASIERGFVVLLGIHVEDTATDVDYLVPRNGISEVETEAS
jgi:D-tyrosyl-tRNA(Tyr) deacylase